MIMDPSFTLRRITPADIGPIASVLMRAFFAQDARIWLARPDFLRRYIEECPSAAWAAERQGRISGVVFGHAQGFIGWIGPLAISPREQNQGLGTALYGVCLQALRQCGCQVIGLDSRQDPATVKFYQRMGLEQIDETVDVLCEIGQDKIAADQLLTFSRTPAPVFSKAWSDLQQELIMGADYLTTLQRCQRYGCGDGAIWLRQGKASALLMIQTGARLSGESPGVARLHLAVARPGVGWPEIRRAVDHLARLYDPRCTHLVVRVSADAQAAVQTGEQSFPSIGLRWATVRLPEVSSWRLWMWE